MALLRTKPAATDTAAYLRRVGERVRTLRSRRGLTRKALARAARVSERYLAQLESGANGSITLLRRIAGAIGVPLAHLVADGSEPPLDLALLTQFLERLSPEQRMAAHELLEQRFSTTGEEVRRGRIALIGLRGAGKSTLGRLVGENLGVPFIELDREVERRSGVPMSEIFDMLGAETFRRTEREALEEVLYRHPRFVMAASGSIVTDAGTFQRLLSSCFTVWLRAQPEEHMRRVMDQGDLRPMANSARAMDDLVALLESRTPLYARADETLDTSGRTPEMCAGELLRRLAVPDNRIGRRSA